VQNLGTNTYQVLVNPGSHSGNASVQLLNYSDASSSVSSDTYSQTVLGDKPLAYWRLDETALMTALDAVPALQFGVAGPTSPDNAVSLTNSAYVGTAKQVNNPSVYSEEIWFKTPSGYGAGGKLIGFGSSQTGSSSSYDRQIYMTNAGKLIFGQYTGSVITVTSSSAYNDGNWHHAVGTYNGSTMVLYVDGASVGSTSSGAPWNYNAYWRIGYDNLSGWPSAPSSYYFQGSIGEAAIYSSALTATQVSNHYNAATGGTYDSTVLGDSPTSYWKLNESSGPTFADATGGGNPATAEATNNNGLYEGSVTLNQTGALSDDAAVGFDGSTSYLTTLLQYTNPTAYSLELWFKTASGYSTGGKLIGFGSSQTGSSTNYDRNIYMTNAGNLIFGQNPSGGLKTITSSSAYNDGNWHHAVGTYDGSNLVLYVDGSSVGSISSGAPQNYNGYWRVGYDNLYNWPSAPSSYYFKGTLDEPAVYNFALTATQVSNHYVAAGY
jgi:hypothetical protein